MINDDDINEICPDHIFDDPEKTEREMLNKSSGFLDSSKKFNRLKEVYEKKKKSKQLSKTKKAQDVKIRPQIDGLSSSFSKDSHPFKNSAEKDKEQPREKEKNVIIRVNSKNKQQLFKKIKNKNQSPIERKKAYLKEILKKSEDKLPTEEKIQPIGSEDHSHESIKNIQLREPSFSQQSSNNSKNKKSHLRSPTKFQKKKELSNHKLTWFKRAVALIISKEINTQYEFITWFPSGYFLGQFFMLPVSIYRFYVFYIAIILAMVVILLQITFYDGEGYPVFLTSLLPIIGMMHTVAVSIEYKLSTPYMVYHKWEPYTLVFDMGKFFLMFLTVLWDTELWFVIGVIASIAVKLSIKSQIKNNLRFFSYFCDIFNLLFDGLLLLTALEWAQFLTWGPLLMLLGVLTLMGEFYCIFLFVQAGNDFFAEADKVSIICLFSLAVMTIINGGIINNFEKHVRLKGVLIFVFLIQFFIVVGLGVYFYMLKDLKPTHIKINLKKKMLKPNLWYGDIHSHNSSSSESNKESNKIKKDPRSYFKTIMQKNILKFIFPERFKIEKHCKCYGCGQVSSRNVYHAPAPCFHSMYCINCATYLIEQINYCLICNRKVQFLKRIEPNTILNNLLILDTIDHVHSQKLI